jgi:phosphatidate cytidylyltransferase
MTNFWQRTVSGVFIVGIIVAASWGGYYSGLALLSIIGAIGLDELLKMGEPESRKNKLRWIGAFHSTIFLLGLWLKFETNWLSLLTIQLVIASIGCVLTFQEHSFKELAKLFFGWIWIWLPVFLAKDILEDFLLRFPMILLLVFIGLWTSDSGAYLVGKSMGKHKMIPHVSPNKTWEGTIGGMLLAAMMVSIFAHYFVSMDWIKGGVLGGIISFFGTFGDLIQSVVKRTFGVKDSGNLIPGHGGILDRFDSFLLAIPAVWLALSLF